MKKSWKTSLAGWLAVVAAVASMLASLLDGDPSTKPDFQAVMSALSMVGIGLGLFFARDNDRSSEDVGAK